MSVDYSKSALITGCSSAAGIGAGLVRAFAKRGIHVFATARNQSDLSHLEDLNNVTLLPLDVTSSDSIARTVLAVNNKTNGKLDYLVNNAATTGITPLLEGGLILPEAILK